jgi:hypothetical protein
MDLTGFEDVAIVFLQTFCLLNWLQFVIGPTDKFVTRLAHQIAHNLIKHAHPMYDILNEYRVWHGIKEARQWPPRGLDRWMCRQQRSKRTRSIVVLHRLHIARSLYIRR